jgi:hypothetical protein
VSPEEAEDVFFLRHSKKEKRYYALGQTKKLPEFRNEDEERNFWATADATEYLDLQAGKHKKLGTGESTRRAIPILAQGFSCGATGARAPASPGIAPAASSAKPLSFC